jgi:excisionase family DNA binding protein
MGTLTINIDLSQANAEVVKDIIALARRAASARPAQGRKALLTLREAAEYAGYSYWYFRRLAVEQGKIPHQRPNDGRIMFRRSDIDRWLTSPRRRVGRPRNRKNPILS